MNSVKLTGGDNTINVSAMDTVGNESMATITVFLDTTASVDWIELLVNPASGVAPLTATLRIDNHLSFSPAGPPQISYSGGDNVELTWVTDTELDMTFQNPGIYTLYGELTDPQGNPVRGEVKVNVLDPGELDALLQAKWEGMKGAMIAGDIEGAVSYFAFGQRETFRQIYTLVADKLEQKAADMQAIEMIYQKNDRAEYRLRRDIIFKGEPVTATFYVYFQREPDGIWRIWDY